MLEMLRTKIAAGERLTPNDGEAVLTTMPLTELGAMANRDRFRRHPAREVTYVIDSNPNYTNVCNIDCVFCAFYRHEDEPGAYTHAVDEVLEQIGWAVEQGATTALLQGGVNPALPFEYYLSRGWPKSPVSRYAKCWGRCGMPANGRSRAEALRSWRPGCERSWG
jgi:cyclic dehypoxanthinyl futalosine synthase